MAKSGGRVSVVWAEYLKTFFHILGLSDLETNPNHVGHSTSIKILLRIFPIIDMSLFLSAGVDDAYECFYRAS